MDEWIIQAAVEGLMEELLPIDESLHKLYQTTTPGSPYYVSSLDEKDYYLIPFNSDAGTTCIVVRVDAKDGAFQEASWVNEPVKYLPIDGNQAVQLALIYLEEQGFAKGEEQRNQPCLAQYLLQ